MLVTWLNHGIKYIDCDRRNLMWPFLTAITTLTVLDDSQNWSPGRNQQLLCLQVWLSAGGTLHSSTIFSNELGSAIGQIPSRKRRRQALGKSWRTATKHRRDLQAPFALHFQKTTLVYACGPKTVPVKRTFLNIAIVGWGVVGWGGHVNVPCTSYMIYCHAAEISRDRLLRDMLLRCWDLWDRLLRDMLLRCWDLWDRLLRDMLLRCWDLWDRLLRDMLLRCWDLWDRLLRDMLLRCWDLWDRLLRYMLLRCVWVWVR